MRLPEVADRLRQIADQHQIDELHALAAEIRRRPAKSRAAPHSTRMTPMMADAIRRYHRDHPGASQVEIAQFFGVNPGRVSEALRGFRT